MRHALARVEEPGLPGRRGLLFVPRVGGSDPGFPDQQLVAEGFDLLFVLLLYDVVAFVGVFREVEVLIALVAVVVDVFLVVLYARQARVLVVAACPEGAMLGRREHGGPGVGAALDTVAQQLRHRRQDVELVDRRLDPLAVLPPPGLVDDERYMKSLVVDGVVVLLETVLVEPLPVVAENDKGSLVVEPEIPVLIEEVPQEEILVAHGVQVAVELLILRELLLTVAVGDDVLVVARRGEVGRQERSFSTVFLEPFPARIEHDIVLVAEVVGLFEALLVHVLGRKEILVPEVLHELRAPLEPLGRRLEEDGVVAVVLQKNRQTP